MATPSCDKKPKVIVLGGEYFVMCTHICARISAYVRAPDPESAAEER